MPDPNPAPAPLFAAFAASSYAEWLETTLASLQGAPFEKLISQTAETIALNPLYFAADTAGLPFLDTLPGEPPYLRGTHAEPRPWLIAQEVGYATPAEVNAALRSDLARGQTAVNLLLDIPSRLGQDPDEADPAQVGRGGMSLATVQDLAAALDGIDLTTTPLFVRAGTAVLPVLTLLAAHAAQSGQDIAQVSGSLEADPLGELARRGRIPLALDQAYDEAAAAARYLAERGARLRVFMFHGYPYHESGGSAVEELAAVLATAVDALRACGARGIDVNTAAGQMSFAFAIGGNLFMEVAKLRAARLLWSQIVAAFGGDTDACKMVIHGRTARFNKTQTDPYVNMLRGTTEAFAAAVGGVDSLHVSPFDEPLRAPDAFSRRIARNAQIILQDEAGLSRLVDPAGGAYFVEWLTDQVAQKAWALFQEIEALGGMAAALEAGFIQERIAGTAMQRARNLARRKDVLVGTNMYANVGETPLAESTADAAAVAQRIAAFRDWKQAAGAAAEMSHAAAMPGVAALVKAAPRATIGAIVRAIRPDARATAVPPLAVHRAAEPFEQLRAAVNPASPPRIFLAAMGPLRQHKARADFTRGFFEVGGFDLIYPDGFDTPEAAADAALASGATAVVICSTDDTYPDIVPPLVARFKAARPDGVVILAGYPKDQIEAHRAAGVDEFIYLGADCLALNRWLQAQLL